VQIILILLRLIHIAAGAFWAGSGLMLALVVLPGMRQAGPGGERALPMARVSQAMSIGALLTTATGLVLYVWVSGLAWNWIASSQGLGFTLGSLAGLASFLLGLVSTGPTAARIGALAGQLQAAGGPPRPEQAAEMDRLKAKLAVSSAWSTILSTVALVFMAVARYL